MNFIDIKMHGTRIKKNILYLFPVHTAFIVVNIEQYNNMEQSSERSYSIKLYS